jgi:multicomponent Na+:H+ antiporter subunit D
MLSEQSELGPRELGGFTCLFLLLVGALIGAALTADLVNLFVWFEVAALASYALTAFFLERPLALEASFKILVLTNVASFLIFIAAALVYAGHGALNLGQIHDALAGHPGVADLAALGLLVAGFATKAGLVPFHGWLPDAHTAAPGPVSAAFSGLMVNVGIVAIGRIVFSVYAPAGRPVLGLLMGLGLVSALGGALFALFSDDLKRLLAYDTTSQMGVLAVGLGAGTGTGLAGSAYHLVNHALFKSLLFLCAGAIVHATGATRLSEMAGVGRRMPWLGVAFAVAALAIAGIPPLNGYVSVGLIHAALAETHQYVPYAVMVVAQVVTVAALGRAAVTLYRPARGEYERDERLRPGMLVALLLLGGACVGFGVFASQLLGGVIAPAAQALHDAPGYAHAVLAGGGTISPGHVPFEYFAPAELVTVLVTLVVAVPLARWAIRHSDARPIARLRAIQTGSVNDYAGYQVVGLIVVVTTLTAGAFLR